MALRTSEIERIKIELGFNALGLSALPYAIDGITQLFEQVVGPYLQAGELNYTSTVVAAAAAPASVVLSLLTTPTSIKVGDRLIVDQDAAQEAATVSAVTLSTATVSLIKAHAGTYPVTVEGGESMARYYLGQCIDIAQRISRAAGRSGIKKVDEVEFFPSTSDQKGVADSLIDLQRYWRNELASCLGVPNLREQRRGAGQRVVQY